MSYSFEKFFAKNVPGFEFNEETHTYSIDGNVVPSVSSFLESSGLKPFIPYKSDGKPRGKRVHHLTELFDIGLYEHDEEYGGYVDAWEAFLLYEKAKVLFSETLVYNPVMNLAGTIDRFIEMNGKIYIEDSKTGSNADWHKYQLALYALIIEEPEIGRCNVVLKPNGKYRLIIRDDPQDIVKAGEKIFEKNVLLNNPALPV